MNDAEAVILAQTIGRSEAMREIAGTALKSKASVGLVVLGAVVVGWTGGIVSCVVLMKKAFKAMDEEDKKRQAERVADVIRESDAERADEDKA